jgi:hypothetical protein
MANRGITNQAQLTAMARTSQRCAELVEVTLGTTVYRFTNGSFNVTVGSNTYLAVGDFIGFSDVEESSDMSINSVTITMSLIDPTTIANWLEDDYIDRPVKIYRVYFDEAWQVIGSPLLMFDGRIDRPVIQDTGTTVTVGCSAASQWTDFNRRNGRFTSQELQQAIFATDMGFEYAAVDTPNLKWGG